MNFWLNLPDIVFSDIMMILKQNSLEDIHRCRQVCQSWNVMIAQMTKFKKDMIRRKADSLTAKIREKYIFEGEVLISYRSPQKIAELVSAASLAHIEKL